MFSQSSIFTPSSAFTLISSFSHSSSFTKSLIFAKFTVTLSFTKSSPFSPSDYSKSTLFFPKNSSFTNQQESFSNSSPFTEYISIYTPNENTFIIYLSQINKKLSKQKQENLFRCTLWRPLHRKMSILLPVKQNYGYFWSINRSISLCFIHFNHFVHISEEKEKWQSHWAKQIRNFCFWKWNE